MKIHPAVNVSRVCIYKNQIEDQKKEQPLLVVIEEEEKYEVEKILNKRKFRGKDRYLVWWKGYIAKENTWESKENLGNTRNLVERFEEEYREESKWARKEDYKKSYRGELLERYIAKILYG